MLILNPNSGIMFPHHTSVMICRIGKVGVFYNYADDYLYESDMIINTKHMITVSKTVSINPAFYVTSSIDGDFTNIFFKKDYVIHIDNRFIQNDFLDFLDSINEFSVVMNKDVYYEKQHDGTYLIFRPNKIDTATSTAFIIHNSDGRHYSYSTDVFYDFVRTGRIKISAKY